MDRRQFLGLLVGAVVAPTAVVKVLTRRPRVPQGILVIKNEMTSEQLAAFRRAWNRQLATASSAWKVPILHADSVEFVRL